MFVIDEYDVEIRVKLDNGIYILNNQSATGKTRLCKQLDRYRAYGEAVASYTYNDYLKGLPIETVLIPGKFKVIMIDRYDMYEGIGIELMKQCMKDSVILVDCKRPVVISDEDDWCDIEMTANCIEVSNDNYI